MCSLNGVEKAMFTGRPIGGLEKTYINPPPSDNHRNAESETIFLLVVIEFGGKREFCEII